MAANISDLRWRPDGELSEEYQEIPSIYANVPITSKPVAVANTTGGSEKLCKQEPGISQCLANHTKVLYGLFLVELLIIKWQIVKIEDRQNSSEEIVNGEYTMHAIVYFRNKITE